jgi:hypothetical protein
MKGGSMSENSYRVIFAGEIIEGENLESVQERLAVHFKLNHTQAERLFSDRAVVLKKGISHKQAKEYQEFFAGFGARCRVIKESGCG